MKNNKLATILLIIVGYFLFNSYKTNRLYTSSLQMADGGYAGDEAMGKSLSYAPTIGNTRLSLPYEPAPQPDVTDRMVVQETNLSLLVKNVVETRNKILASIKESGGYMVSANTSNPQDAPTGTVVFRVPSDKLEATLEYLHSLAVKIVSENLSGYDVTDQYVNVEKRIGYLEQTISQYRTILASAQEISDITQLTTQIIQTQQQIDSLMGQQEAMKQKAKMAKVTVYLSTDEIALPYAPSETWRPAVIFKQAVRAMVSDLRKVGSAAIWLVVYAVFWIPALVIIWYVRKFFQKKPTTR